MQVAREPARNQNPSTGAFPKTPLPSKGTFRILDLCGTYEVAERLSRALSSLGWDSRTRPLQLPLSPLSATPLLNELKQAAEAGTPYNMLIITPSHLLHLSKLKEAMGPNMPHVMLVSEEPTLTRASERLPKGNRPDSIVLHEPEDPRLQSHMNGLVRTLLGPAA